LHIHILCINPIHIPYYACPRGICWDKVDSNESHILVFGCLDVRMGGLETVQFAGPYTPEGLDAYIGGSAGCILQHLTYNETRVGAGRMRTLLVQWRHPKCLLW